MFMPKLENYMFKSKIFIQVDNVHAQVENEVKGLEVCKYTMFMPTLKIFMFKFKKCWGLQFEHYHAR